MEKITLKLENDAPGIGRAGQVVTLELKPSDVHDPTELPSYLAGYSLPDMRADEASPVVLVEKDSDKYRTFDQDDAFTPVNVKGALNGQIPEIDTKSALATYKVVDRFVGSFIPVRTQMQASYDARMAAARRIRRILDLDREIDVWTLLGTTTSWAAAQRLALGAGQNWNGGANSDPIKDLNAACEAAAQPVNGIWMNEQLSNAFLRHPKVIDYFKSRSGDAAAMQQVAQVQDDESVDYKLPGLPPIHVLRLKYKPAATLDYILASQYVVLVHNQPGVPADGETISASKTFRVRGPSNVGFEAREFFVQDRGPNGGTMLVASMADLAVMTGNNCGGIISGAYV